MEVIRDLINKIRNMAYALQGGVVDSPNEVLESNAIPKEIKKELNEANKRVDDLISGKDEKIKNNNQVESNRLEGRRQGGIDERTRGKDRKDVDEREL